MDLKKTIASIATAPGNGAIAIIRISGEKALFIAGKIFSKRVDALKTHTVHYGKILSKEKTIIDEVLLIYMKAPHSFTGEDVIEIHCHGGLFLTKKLLNRVFEAGASPAMPGEFSLRAFQNNKIDLTRAEAIQKIISAKNNQALISAEKHLEGALFQMIERFQKEITQMAAIMEAAVDFPEEDLEFTTHEKISFRLETLIKKMEQLENTFEYGKKIHQGLTLTLCGSVNVGKSSLLNALLRKEKSIVTNIAGTTRDLLEEDLFLSNFHLKAIDTAGIRITEDIIEKEGIKRSKKAIETADIILCVLDSEKGLTEEDKELLNSLPDEKTIVIWNKTDLNKIDISFDPKPTISISAKKMIGIEKLTELIENHIASNGIEKEEVILSEKRHKIALSEAINSCKTALLGLNDHLSPEFIASDMKQSLLDLAQIIGTDVTEDVLDSVFSQFCLGK